MKYYPAIYKRKKQLSDTPTLLITYIVCISCWVFSYYNTTNFPLSTDSSLWQLFYNLITNKAIACVTGFFLYIVTGYMMKKICDNEMITGVRSSLIFMLFMLMVSINGALATLTEANAVLLLLVFMLYYLFKLYQNPEATGIFFNAALLTALSSLFLPQMLLFMPLFWFGMYQFRSLSLKSFLATLTSIFSLFWILLVLCVWKHDYSLLTNYFGKIADINFISLNINDLRYAGVLFLLILSFWSIKTGSFSNSVRIRQMLSFMLNMALWSLLMMVLYGKSSDLLAAVLYLPCSAIFAYMFENIRTKLRFYLYYLILAYWVFTFFLHVWTF